LSYLQQLVQLLLRTSVLGQRLIRVHKSGRIRILNAEPNFAHHYVGHGTVASGFGDALNQTNLPVNVVLEFLVQFHTDRDFVVDTAMGLVLLNGDVEIFRCTQTSRVGGAQLVLPTGDGVFQGPGIEFKTL
jgi:hypothetical protein